MKPFISIIIPNYNHAQFLEQRITSILNQTYQNYEIIILDDNSSDNSVEVIDKFKTNIHVSQIILNESNSGSTFKQWDKGFSLAKGEWIWIAESDDFCESDLLEKLVKAIETDEKMVLAFSTSMLVDKEGKHLGYKNKIGKDIRIDGHDFVKRYMTMDNYLVNASSAIFRKNAIPQNTTYKEYKGAGDKLFWIEVALQGNICIVRKALNYFRQHGNKVTPKRILDGTNFQEEYRTHVYLEEKGIISKMRSFVVKAFYCRIISQTKFNDEILKNKLIGLWGGDKYLSFIPSFSAIVVRQLRKHFDYYI